MRDGQAVSIQVMVQEIDPSRGTHRGVKTRHLIELKHVDQVRLIFGKLAILGQPNLEIAGFGAGLQDLRLGDRRRFALPSHDLGFRFAASPVRVLIRLIAARFDSRLRAGDRIDLPVVDAPA